MCEWAGHGMHPVFAEYAVGLSLAGPTVLIGTSGREYEPGTVKKANQRGLEIVRLPAFFDKENSFVGAVRELATWLHGNEVDVIHCQGFRELSDVKRACWIAGKRPVVVCTDRNSTSWGGLGALKRIICLLWYAPSLVVLSKTQIQRLQSIPYIGRAYHVPNSVNTKLFRCTPKDRPSEAIVQRIVYPASLTPKKGHSDLLDICSDLLSQGLSFQMMLAGEGQNEEVLKAKAKSLGLSNSVTFVGRIPWREMPGFYSSASIGVFPSYSEMMPNALLEMMAMELPVVAYAAGGIPCILKNEETGYVCDIGDTKSFGAYLKRLLLNPTKSRLIGKAARRQVETFFSIEAVGLRLAEVYLELQQTR